MLIAVVLKLELELGMAVLWGSVTVVAATADRSNVEGQPKIGIVSLHDPVNPTNIFPHKLIQDNNDIINNLLVRENYTSPHRMCSYARRREQCTQDPLVAAQPPPDGDDDTQNSSRTRKSMHRARHAQATSVIAVIVNPDRTVHCVCSPDKALTHNHPARKSQPMNEVNPGIDHRSRSHSSPAEASHSPPEEIHKTTKRKELRLERRSFHFFVLRRVFVVSGSIPVFPLAVVAEVVVDIALVRPCHRPYLSELFLTYHLHVCKGERLR